MPPTNHRRCLSCRKLDDKTAFWRIVRLFPSRAIQLDQGMGRSVYLCANADCLRAAQRKDRVGRSLKAPVPDEIYRLLWERLTITPGSLSSNPPVASLSSPYSP